MLSLLHVSTACGFLFPPLGEDTKVLGGGTDNGTSELKFLRGATTYQLTHPHGCRRVGYFGEQIRALDPREPLRHSKEKNVSGPEIRENLQNLGGTMWASPQTEDFRQHHICKPRT